MRVLQMVRIFHPSTGGMEKHVEWLGKHLRQRGHTVDVVTLDRSVLNGAPLGGFSQTEGMNVYRIPWRGSGRYPIAPRAWQFIHRYDVVHVHALDGLVDLALLTRRWHQRPVVLSTHGGFFHTPYLLPLKKLWFQTLTRLTLSQVDALIYTSDQDADLFRPLMDTPALEKKAQIIRSAVDFSIWRGAMEAHTPGQWVCFGRLDTHKGLSDLLKALAALKSLDARPFTVRILGGEAKPGLQAALEQERDALGLQGEVRFEGRAPQEVLAQAVASAELALFPSTYESFGLSVVEAMHLGVVPVFNDIAAFRYFARGGLEPFLTRFSEPMTAARAIAAARDRVAASPVALQALVKQAASPYGWEQAAAEIEAVYQRVTAGSAGATESTSSASSR